jgi:hypothetical protein
LAVFVGDHQWIVDATVFEIAHDRDDLVGFDGPVQCLALDLALEKGEGRVARFDSYTVAVLNEVERDRVARRREERVCPGRIRFTSQPGTSTDEATALDDKRRRTIVEVALASPVIATSSPLGASPGVATSAFLTVVAN